MYLYICVCISIYAQLATTKLYYKYYKNEI